VTRVVPAVVVTLAVGVSACSLSGASSSAPPAASPSTNATPSSAPTLDHEVPLPASFPADLPVYPGARLTAAATFVSNNHTTWGMEWETLDTVDKVQAFYASKLAQGDWTISFSGSASGQFSAVFNRKSSSSFSGILGADGSSGVTKISMSLAS
jgi:hypothetical protein